MSEHTADIDADRECCWCGKVAPVAYVDVLDLDWCEACYQDTFLENFTPDAARVTPPVVGDAS